MSSRLAIAGVSMLLLLTVGAANVVITAERTALNEEYVSNTLESEGVYESMTDEAQATIQSEIESFSPENSQQVPDGVDFADLDARALAERSVPESYVRSQANGNIDRVFAYLHGERSEPGIRIDTDPLAANVSDAVSEQVQAVDPAGLLNDASFTIEGYEVDGSLAQELYQSRARYQAYRSDIRARTSAAEREEINSEAKSEASARAQQATGQYDQQITQGTITIQEAVIDGLTDDDMTYEEFRDAYDAGHAQIAAGAGQAAANEIDNQVSTSDLLDPELESTLQDTRGYVQTIDTLQVALPLAALVLIALLYGITRAWQPTANATGKVFVIAGAVALVAVLVQSALLGIVEDRVGSELQTNDVVGMDLVTSFVEGIFETLTVQSSVLVVFGLVLLGVVYADENRHLDDVNRSLGVEPSAAGGAAGPAPSRARQQQGTHQPPQEQQGTHQPPRKQSDPRPRQPTGRSVARQGPQNHRPQSEQPSENTPQHKQPDDQQSGPPQDDQQSGPPQEGSQTAPSRDERNSARDQQPSAESSAPSQDETQSAPSQGDQSRQGQPTDVSQDANSSGESHPEQGQDATQSQPPTDERGDDASDRDDTGSTASGSLDAWETTDESEDE